MLLIIIYKYNIHCGTVFDLSATIKIKMVLTNCNSKHILPISPCILKMSLQSPWSALNKSTSFPKVTYDPYLIHSLSSPCTLVNLLSGSELQLTITASVVIQWAFSLFVSWVKRQSRLVELKDVLLSRQYTSRSAFPCVLTPTGQGVLNLPHRGLP